jgi:EAL domain-containing protein (putative c-di-GMP-specific phosphodiesterase class I)
MQQIIDEIEKRGMHPSQFIIEIHQNHLIGSPNAFGDLLQTYRAKGLRFLIDHFGAGRAGLNLLEPYRPDLIALNKYLVMGVHTNGPRQAIVKGLLQTCKELAIDVVAKFVIDLDEYEWLKEAGVDYVQGNLFGEPTTNNPTQATNDNE